ncbi:MAG TPA: hypothetical protein VHL11_01430 [Phototrophicaceae bacterium]|jgi:hypothetical protein|nr:hypothetical protein [Phototrophicaceae bacterium]
MIDLEALAATIRQLTPEERERLDRLVEHPPLTPEEKIKLLRKGRDELWEGISKDDMSEIIQAMNIEADIVPPQVDEDIQTRIRILNTAFAEMGEGLNEHDLAEMVEVMNAEPEQLDHLVEKHPENKQSLSSEKKIAALRRGRDKFREGISDEEMHQIAIAMNTESIKSDPDSVA